MERFIKKLSASISSESSHCCVFGVPELFKTISSYFPGLLDIGETTESVVEKIIMAYFLDKAWGLEYFNSSDVLPDKKTLDTVKEIHLREDMDSLKVECFDVIDRLYGDISIMLSVATSVKVVKCLTRKNEIVVYVRVPPRVTH